MTDEERRADLQRQIDALEEEIQSFGWTREDGDRLRFLRQSLTNLIERKPHVRTKET